MASHQCLRSSPSGDRLVLQQLFQGRDQISHRGTGMTPGMRIGLIVSAVLHVVVVLALLFGLPSSTPKDEEPPETTVTMVFQGTAKSSMQAPVPANVPSPLTD